MIPPPPSSTSVLAQLALWPEDPVCITLPPSCELGQKAETQNVIVKAHMGIETRSIFSFF